MSKPILAVVGRPNVGKSTFFNRIIGERKAIVEDVPGVTRDRIYAETEWNGREFAIIDTGGIEASTDDPILSQMRDQAVVAMDMADLILFMVDGKEGLTTADIEVGAILRRTGKKVILVVNKIDNPSKMPDTIYDFYELGLGEPIPISSANMLNIGDLLDEIVNISLETEAPYWRYMSFEYSGFFSASITDDKLLMSWAKDGFQDTASIEELIQCNSKLDSVKAYLVNEHYSWMENAPTAVIKTTRELDDWILKTKEFMRRKKCGTPVFDFNIIKPSYQVASLNHPSKYRQMARNFSDKDALLIRYKSKASGGYVASKAKIRDVISDSIHDACFFKKEEAVEKLMTLVGCGIYAEAFFELVRIDTKKNLWVVRIEQESSRQSSNICYLENPARAGKSGALQNVRGLSDIGKAYHFSSKESAEAKAALLRPMLGIISAEVVEDEEYIEKLRKEGLMK